MKKSVIIALLLLAPVLLLLSGCAGEPRPLSAAEPPLYPTPQPTQSGVPNVGGFVTAVPAPPLPQPRDTPQPAGPPQPIPAQGPSALTDLGGVLFYDDFSQDSLASYAALEPEPNPAGPGLWTVQDGMLLQLGDASEDWTMRPTALLNGESGWRDYEVTADAYSEGNMDMGLVFRYNGGDYYLFRVPNPLSAGFQMTLEKRLAGERVILATRDTVGFSTMAWHTLRVQVVGPEMRAYLDGKLVLEAKDESIATGAVGVYTVSQGRMRFDNLSVRPVSH